MEDLSRNIGPDGSDSYEELQRLGDCYYHSGQMHSAGLCYARAAQAGPDEPLPYVGTGLIAYAREDIESAEIAFRVAARLDPTCSKAYAGLAVVNQGRGLFKQAFELYLKSLQLDTDNLTALLGLFQTSCQMGSFAKVIHFLEIYLKSHPDDTSVMFSLATLYVKEARLDQARDMLNEIILIDADNTDAAELLEEVEHDIDSKAVQAVEL